MTPPPWVARVELKPAAAQKGDPMSDSDTATTYVYPPEDIVWHKTDLGSKFWLSDDFIGDDYSSDFSTQLTKFGPAADLHRTATPKTT
jgi:hypothetical protein